MFVSTQSTRASDDEARVSEEAQVRDFKIKAQKQQVVDTVILAHTVTVEYFKHSLDQVRFGRFWSRSSRQSSVSEASRAGTCLLPPLLSSLSETERNKANHIPERKG